MIWLVIDCVLMLALAALAIYGYRGWGRSLKREGVLSEENAALYRMMMARTDDERLEAWTAWQCASNKLDEMTGGPKR